MAVQANRRVLVYFSNKSNSSLIKGDFTQSIVDALDGDGHVMDVYARMNGEDQLQVGNQPFADAADAIKMKRPSFCPIHNLSSSQRDELTEDVTTRGIDTGAAILLEAADGKVLLTRRAQHLRTFPGIWVPPGGHIEYGETLQEAGLRELREETGLDITADMCVGNVVPVLAMWESCYPPKLCRGLPRRHHLVSYLQPVLKMPFTSRYLHKLLQLNTQESVYPPMLSMGLPRRHHAVVYLYVHLASPYTSDYLATQLNPDGQEVGACAWLEPSILSAVAAGMEDGPQRDHKQNLPEKFSALIVSKDGTTQSSEIYTSALLNEPTEDIKDVERVSTGTKFALAEWLQKRT